MGVEAHYCRLNEEQLNNVIETKIVNSKNIIEAISLDQSFDFCGTIFI